MLGKRLGSLASGMVGEGRVTGPSCRQAPLGISSGARKEWVWGSLAQHLPTLNHRGCKTKPRTQDPPRLRVLSAQRNLSPEQS